MEALSNDTHLPPSAFNGQAIKYHHLHIVLVSFAGMEAAGPTFPSPPDPVLHRRATEWRVPSVLSSTLQPETTPE